MPEPRLSEPPLSAIEHDPRPAGEGALRALLAQEQMLLAARRRIALPRPEGETDEGDMVDSRLNLPRVGLAISGGGVRSATFGLGLLRGLAQSKVLARIDYLSTVSGGGFIGALFGRMVSALGITQAQAMLASAPSPILRWLRRHGRYLTPVLARDRGIAVVTYLRAIVAVNAEALLTCLPLVLLVMTPHLLQQGTNSLDPANWQSWRTLWWPLALATWLLAAPATIVALGVARDSIDPSQVRAATTTWNDVLFTVVLALAALAASVAVWPGPDRLRQGEVGSLAMVGVLLSCVVGLAYTPLSRLASHEKDFLAMARLRDRLTRALHLATLVTLAMAIVGALDVTSWWLLEGLQSGEPWAWGGLGLGGAGLLIMRALAQSLPQFVEKADAYIGIGLGPSLLNVAGWLSLLLLALAWLVLAQWLVFAPEPLTILRDYSPGVRALGLLAIAALWWVLSARNEQMANASSLHSFYRARLTRAYLAVGNPARGILADSVGPTHTNVTEVVPGDDLDLRDYGPEAQGGPIHLVNACLNQTRDDASGLYNADRMGTLVTASARAFEIGPNQVVPLPSSYGVALADVGTLGRWVAVSGAVTTPGLVHGAAASPDAVSGTDASPGAGSYSSSGWALALFFLGVRVGYWMRAPRSPLYGWPAGVMRMWTRAVKPLMLWSEASASFFGMARPWWYLSDGGHFDNTGVYPLLKRRLDFIVLADNSADPMHAFGDLENLVRKARIDLDAEIEFYTRQEAAALFAGSYSDKVCVLSPEEYADDNSRRSVLLARIRYAPAPDGSRADGTLLVVKPNLHDALDLDVLAYAKRHPKFPHESTSELNFDEAQWESYQRLGEDIGQALGQAWLDQLPGWSRRGAHPMTMRAAHLRGAEREGQPHSAKPQPLRSIKKSVAVIGAALVSGALLLWQVSEQLHQISTAEQAEAQRLFTEVSRELRGLDGSCPKVGDYTAAQLMVLKDLRNSPRLGPIELAGIGQLIAHLREECERLPSLSPDCKEAVRRAKSGICAVVNKPATEGSALNYWHPTPARATLAGIFGRGPGDVPLASALPANARPPAASGGTSSVEAGSAASAPPTMYAESRASESQVGFMPATASPSASAASDSLAEVCGRSGRPLQVYVQTYDDASLGTAGAVVRALQTEGGGVLRTAPIENVSRAALLRGERRPVPWPQPTLVVHDAADRACISALATAIRAALPAASGREAIIWVRELPRSLNPQSGVIELWIPPRE